MLLSAAHKPCFHSSWVHHLLYLPTSPLKICTRYSWVWHCRFIGSWLLFRTQSSKSCTPQCHSLRLLCVCILCFILSGYLICWTLASWSYYEPFLERYVHLATITTALGATLTFTFRYWHCRQLTRRSVLSLTSISIWVTKHHDLHKTRFACFLQHCLRYLEPSSLSQLFFHGSWSRCSSFSSPTFMQLFSIKPVLENLRCVSLVIRQHNRRVYLMYVFTSVLVNISPGWILQRMVKVYLLFRRCLEVLVILSLFRKSFWTSDH